MAVLTGPWQASIDGGNVTIADGDYCADGSVKGLGVPDVEDLDMPRGSRHGHVAGVDRYNPRVIIMPLTVRGTGCDREERATSAWPKVQALKKMWKPPTDNSEQALDLQIPGFPTSSEVLRFFGRCRGLEVSYEPDGQGHVPCLATFRALDPLGYGASETHSGSGSFAVTNNGDEFTDRVVLTLTGSGAAPVLTNTTTGETVRFSSGLSGTAVLDMRTGTVTVGGLPVYPIAPGPLWWGLVPGVNNLSLTGLTSADVTFRPAYV